MIWGGWMGLVVVLCCASSLWADSLRLRREVRVSEDVRLGDVAELEGAAAAALAELPVLTWRAGQERGEVTLAQVERLLIEKRVNLATLTVAGFSRCEVVRGEAGATGDADVHATDAAEVVQREPVAGAATLGAQVMPVIEKLAGVERDRLRVVFAADDDAALAQDVTGLRVEVQPGASRLPGRLPLTVRLYDGAAVRETLRLTADVAVRCQAVVMTRGVSRGVTLSEHDVEVKEIQLTTSGQPVADLAGAVGKVTRSALRAGNVVMSDDVRAALSVKRNDLLSVRCLVGGLVVGIVGRAQEDGGDGEIINVRNEKSRQVFRARIAGQGQAVMVIEDETPPTQRQGQGASQ